MQQLRRPLFQEIKKKEKKRAGFADVYREQIINIILDSFNEHY